MKPLTIIEKSILEEAFHGEEAIHGIIYGFLKDHLCEDPKEVVDAVLNLLPAGHVKIYYQSGSGGDPYLDISCIQIPDLRKYLFEYIKKHEAEFGHEYPSGGGEFFVEATDRGKEILGDIGTINKKSVEDGT